MSDPIRLRWEAPPSPADWPTHLTLYAAATGNGGAVADVMDAFGPCVESVDAWGHAHELFDCADDGLTVGTWPAAADVLFDPGDDAHRRHSPDALVVFKRSMPDAPAPNEVAFPAFPRAATVDLECGPAPLTEKPVVSFCGVAHRPAERKAFIDAFRDSDLVDFRLVERDRFYHPDTQTFMDLMRESHFVLCPPGVGRFSYRLYETLAAGRVPVLPAEGHAVAPPLLGAQTWVSRATGPDVLLAQWAGMRNHWSRVHNENRALWQHVASPLAALNHVANEIRRRLPR